MVRGAPIPTPSPSLLEVSRVVGAPLTSLYPVFVAQPNTLVEAPPSMVVHTAMPTGPVLQAGTPASICPDVLLV